MKAVGLALKIKKDAGEKRKGEKDTQEEEQEQSSELLLQESGTLIG